MLTLLLSLAAAPSLACAESPQARILFVRGGEGTGGFLEGGADEQLSDIHDFSESGGNHGWGTLTQTLAGAGFACEQLVEGPAANNTPVDFAALDLSAFDVIVLGSNNADYPSAHIDAVEDFVRTGGGLLVISDANWGRDWGDAPTSDQSFLDRFGLIMNQDKGVYSLRRSDGDFVISGADMGSHPILVGPDGVLGTADDVDEFDGEGVSPITLNPGTSGLSPAVLAKAKNSLRVNDNASGGSMRPVTADDGALVAVSVDAGRVAGHFDRNTFFNLNGAGTSIHRFDNRQYALNLFTWLADGANGSPVGSAFCFGDGSGSPCPCGAVGQPGHGCANSSRPGCQLSASGSASLIADDLLLAAVGAIPGQAGLFFQGSTDVGGGLGTPFGDGLRCAGGVVVRLEVVVPDANGCAVSTTGVAGQAGAQSGQTLRYQYWYRDTNDEPLPCPVGQGAGFNTSNGLEVVWGP